MSHINIMDIVLFSSSPDFPGSAASPQVRVCQVGPDTGAGGTREEQQSHAGAAAV